MQTDHPAGSIRGDPSDALPGLPDDLLGRLQQARQVIDGTGQPTAPAPRGRSVHPCLGQLGCFDPCLPQRPPRIDQQTLRVPHGRLGQIGQLPGDPLHTVFDLVAAQLAAGPQFRRDRVRALARRARPVPQRGTHRAAGSPNPLTRRGDPPYRLAQQPGIGRIAHVRRDHGGVCPDPAGAQQLRLGGLGQQRLVQSLHRGRPATSGQLHQRRRMWHRPVQGNPAEPPPGDRITDLPTQRLVTQPVPKLQKHQPQIRLHRRGRTPDPRIEERHERGEEHRIIEQPVDPRQLVGQLQQLRRKHCLPQRHLITYSTKHDGLDLLLAQGLEAILPVQHHQPADQRADRSK